MDILLKIYLMFTILFASSIRCEEFNKDLDQLRTELHQFVAEEDRHLFVNYDILETIQLLNNLRNDIYYQKHDNQTCHDCVTALTTAKLILKTPEVIKSAAKTICSTPGVKETERVCVGTLTIMSDPVVYILQNSTITIPEMCSVLLDPQCMQHLGLSVTPAVNWVLPLPKPKPFNPRPDSGKQMKMLHMTDIHLDLYYTPGSNALCDEPMCCRSTSHGHNNSAGYWSEMSGVCDTPLSFTEEAVKHIGNNHKDLDFVIWTGDSVPHDEWNSSKTGNLLHINTTTNLVKKYFDGKSVFPIIGNHEPCPFNMYVPNEVSIKSNGQMSLSWLYNTLADDYWSQWINTASAKKAFKTGGYYSIQLNDRLKIVVLNNNICGGRNYWVAYNPVDPDGQLKWFIDELDSAETQGIHVLILTHQPMSACYQSWGNNYMRIVERFANVIVSTYYGHTHYDEIQVLYNKNPTTNETYPISHGYVGSSLTTFSRLNPGYKIFTLDSNGKALDYDLYYTNMTADNIAGKDVIPKWTSEKALKKVYGLDSLTTDSWDQFLTKAKTKDKLVNLYFNHFHRYSESFINQLKTIGTYNMQGLRQCLRKRSRIMNPLYKESPLTCRLY